jgi:cytochrome P450
MAATQLVNAIYIIRGTNCKHLHDLHEKYGNIVRTGPNELSFRSASAVKTIYGGNPRSEDTFHKNMIANMQESGQSDNLFFATGSKHQHYRKIVAPAFSEATIRAQEPMVYEYCTQLVNGLRNRSGTAYFPTAEGIVDIVPWTHFIVSDILSHVLFGSGLGCLKHGEYHPWVAGGFNALIESTYIEAAQRLWPYHKICEYLWIPSSMSEGYQTHLLFSSQKLQERAKEPEPYKYAFPSLVSQHMSEQELLDNVNVVATAAGETTSSTISAALYYLTSNNAVYKKLVTEIREAFRTEEEITSTSTAALLYLKATIRETFRIHPTIPVGLHRVTPKKGKYIDRTWVPGGVGSTQLSSIFHPLTTRGL